MPTITPTPVTAAPSALDRREAAEERAFVDSADVFIEKDETKEAAVKQKRVWVRVTRLCNQRCTFCLDSWNQNGTYVPLAELAAFIRRGKEQGGQRLILSGGEASVHPDFLKLIRYGRELGYEWIQTVTNGQLFAYPEFARKAKLAGLHEATFSMHGHTAKLHDALVGLRGAFERANQGIRNLQALGGVVTNVDVVINRQNARYLRDILDFYLAMGIHEFDLLFIVPFGRGFEDFRDQLFFDPRGYFEDFQRAFEVSKLPGVFLWTNRFPAEHLEGYEHLIQDPHKLHSEVNGGRHNFDGYLQHGVKPDCWGERCAHCFLHGLCRTTMFGYRQMLLAGEFPRVAVDVSVPPVSGKAAAAFDAQRPKEVEVRGGTLAERLAWIASSPLVPGAEQVRVWVYDSGEARALAASAPPSVWATARSGDACEALLQARSIPCVLELSAELAGALLARPELPAPHGAVLRLPNWEYLSESRAHDPSPSQLRALAAAGWTLDNVPACLGGERAREGARDELDRAMLDRRGMLDTDAYVARYIRGEYYAKSLRCEQCAVAASCRGVHINYARSHGLGILTPLASAERPVQAEQMPPGA